MFRFSSMPSRKPSMASQAVIALRLRLLNSRPSNLLNTIWSGDRNRPSVITAFSDKNKKPDENRRTQGVHLRNRLDDEAKVAEPRIRRPCITVSGLGAKIQIRSNKSYCICRTPVAAYGEIRIHSACQDIQCSQQNR